jgi:hypothetical protein
MKKTNHGSRTRSLYNSIIATTVVFLLTSFDDSDCLTLVPKNRSMKRMPPLTFSRILFRRYARSPNNENTDHKKPTEEILLSTMADRRNVLLLGSLLLTESLLPDKASAITMEYPLELRAPSNIDDVRNADNRRIRKINEINQQQMNQREQLSSNPIFGIALWVLSGSRSNPITTPLANLIYDAKQEAWLQDRNDGLFADLPWEYFIILGVVFLVLGFGTDQFVNAIADGDATISLQLAGVALIGGASLELGRISSGVKKPTRTESDRSVQLETEFIDFASNRLQSGGNCHRNEVVQAFRRYYSKYRQAENPDYPLSDLEIEQLLRAYCRAKGLEMSPAGFYSGIQINSNADAFVKK